MPDRETIKRWKKDREDFRVQYARARDEQIEAWADQLIDISDDPDLDPNQVAQAKLRTDNRKWLMSKLKPGVYGDKVQHTDAAGTGPVKIERVVTDPANQDGAGLPAATRREPL